jgi:DNA-binding transcriptional LysR family regulator
MKLSQIKSFVTVAQYGSFSQAAIALDLAQPTVSHAIATLESELGIQLLFRSSKGVNLTPAGEDILSHCQQILQSIAAIHREANKNKSCEGGKVIISTFRGAAAQLLPKIKASFKEKYPQIEIKIAEEKDCPQVEQTIRDGKADLGFTTLPVSPDLEVIEVLKDDYVVLLPPNSEFKRHERLNWQELSQIPLISYPDRNTCFLTIKDYFHHAGYQFQPYEQVRNSETIINLVATGASSGAILPKLSLFYVPEGVTVCQLPTPLQRVVVAAIPRDRDLSHPAWAFLDFLKTVKIFKNLSS